MRRASTLLVTSIAACAVSTSAQYAARPAPEAAVTAGPAGLEAAGEPDPAASRAEEARAEETRVVFAAVLCAYEGARARVGPTGRAQLDGELARIRGMFRAVGVEPRPCSQPLIGRLAECIRVWPEANEILSEWRSDADCSSAEVSAYK